MNEDETNDETETGRTDTIEAPVDLTAPLQVNTKTSQGKEQRARLFIIQNLFSRVRHRRVIHVLKQEAALYRVRPQDSHLEIVE